MAGEVRVKKRIAPTLLLGPDMEMPLALPTLPMEPAALSASQRVQKPPSKEVGGKKRVEPILLSGVAVSESALDTLALQDPLKKVEKKKAPERRAAAPLPAPKLVSLIKKLKPAEERTPMEPTKVIDVEAELERRQATKKRREQREEDKKKATEAANSAVLLPQPLLTSQTSINTSIVPGEGGETKNTSSRDPWLVDDADEVDLEDEEFGEDAPPSFKGSSMLICNLEKYYANGYVDGYDANDEFIDDGQVEHVSALGALRDDAKKANSNADDSDEEPAFRTQFTGFYVHEGEIQFVPVTPKPKKKRPSSSPRASLSESIPIQDDGGPPKKRQKLNSEVKSSAVDMSNAADPGLVPPITAKTKVAPKKAKAKAPISPSVGAKAKAPISPNVGAKAKAPKSPSVGAKAKAPKSPVVGAKTKAPESSKNDAKITPTKISGTVTKAKVPKKAKAKVATAKGKDSSAEVEVKAPRKPRAPPKPRDPPKLKEKPPADPIPAKPTLPDLIVL